MTAVLAWGRAPRVLAALGVVAAAAWAATASGAELLPAPTSWFVDRADLVTPAARQALDHRLEALEKRTGVRLVVIIEPRLPAGEALEDFTLRSLESWTVWHRDRPALALFIFPESRRLRFEVGYGAEGAVTDLEARRILDEDLAPAFRQGAYEAGIARALDSLDTALAGELPPKRSQKLRRSNDSFLVSLLLLVVVWLFILPLLVRRRQSGLRRGGGGAPWGVGGPWVGGGGWGSGSSGGGGSDFGSGGDFSSGGDIFGGGGASGDW